MKRVSWGLLLGGMLLGSAYAAELNTIAKPSLSKDGVAHSAPSAAKESGTVKSKTEKPAASAGKVKRKAKMKQVPVIEKPGDSTDQSVQLKGVRG